MQARSLDPALPILKHGPRESQNTSLRAGGRERAPARARRRQPCSWLFAEHPSGLFADRTRLKLSGVHLALSRNASAALEPPAHALVPEVDWLAEHQRAAADDAVDAAGVAFPDRVIRHAALSDR